MGSPGNLAAPGFHDKRSQSIYRPCDPANTASKAKFIPEANGPEINDGGWEWNLPGISYLKQHLNVNTVLSSYEVAENGL